jgi:hypothetical protein
MMTLADLIAAFRSRAADTKAPYLWSDEEVTRYLNDAINEAATRAHVIRDQVTPAVTQIDIDTDSVTYPLHESILKIDRAKLASQGFPLNRTTIERLDRDWPKWEQATGKPMYYIEDAGRLRLVPRSNVADTLSLIVYRLPLAPLVEDEDAPELHPRDHARLLDWAMRCAYLKEGTETLDEAKAQKYELMFQNSFGRRDDANVERKQREGRVPVVRMRQ